MIRVCEPALTAEDRARLLEAFDRNEIAKGSFLPEAERLLSAITGNLPVRLVANGTAACHLALATLEVARGDKVGVPALTYVATANAVRYCGAEPVFCDVRRDWPTLDAPRARELAAAGVRGIFAVHLYGKVVADLPDLVDDAERAGAWVAEDVAQGMGSTVAGRPTGSWGRAAAFSFYANKNVTSGEGGAVAVATPELLRKLSLLLNQGVDRAGSFDHAQVAFNYRLTNLQAALLVGQLQRMDAIAATKRRIQRWYEERLEPCKLGRMLGFERNEVPWLFTFVFEDAAFRERAAKALEAAGIETRLGFTPIPALAPYGGMSDAELQERFPNARFWSRHVMNLPSALSLTEDQVERIADVLRHA